MMTPNNKIIFITGIDTDIGKTYATGWYARYLMSQGHSVITQKLIQTGCTPTPNCRIIAADLMVHRTLQGIKPTEEDYRGITCPYVFSYPCSPHLASTMAGMAIDPEHMSSLTKRLASRYDYVLIEGAGGLAVPYNQTQTLLDYIASQGYPIMLVTSGRLGSINHTLLSLMACQTHDIAIYALIYNTYQSKPADAIIETGTKTYLQSYLKRHHKKTLFLEMEFLEMEECQPIAGMANT